MMGGRTVRAQVVTYVMPALKAEIGALVAASGHNRETESSVVERLIQKGLEAEHPKRPLQKAHGTPKRSI